MDVLGGSLIPKSKIDQKVKKIVKTKNVPKGLKCKLNLIYFFGNMGSQKGGESDIWGKFPKNPVVFLCRPLLNCVTQLVKVNIFILLQRPQRTKEETAERWVFTLQPFLRVKLPYVLVI